MKKIIAFILSALMLPAMITGCGANNNSSNTPVSTGNGSVDALSSESIQNEEKQPLIIYHISDDEIELHFTSQKLASNELIAFLAPKDGENGGYNTSANLKLERVDGEINPFLMVFNEAMDVDYTVDVYGGEMEASVDGDTLICHIKHENIIAPFAKSALWHIDTENPQPFEGIITDDVSAVVEPVVEGFLPDEFRRSDYDDQYFKPESDDFIVLTYEMPIRLLIPEWYQYYGRDWHYGLYMSEKESTAKITYLISW